MGSMVEGDVDVCDMLHSSLIPSSLGCEAISQGKVSYDLTDVHNVRRV